MPPDIVRPPLRERATSFVLAVAITLLIILGMLGLNGTAEKRPQFKGGPVVLDLKEDDTADATQKPSPKPAPARPKPAAAQPPEPPRPVPPPPLPRPEDMSTHYIHLTPEENAQADISTHPRSPMSSSTSSSVGVQQASGAGDSQPVGTAPDGKPLYAAEWYRHPTDAELRTYLPPHMPRKGWGLVACRTVAAHHVDDCVELGSSPPGSHLAGAVRQAAWQFLVRAPRLGGREMVGAWVRILIEYDIKGADGAETPEDAATPGD